MKFNPKLAKVRKERENTLEKIAELNEKVKTLEADIEQLENEAIVGIVREIKLSPEQLAEFLKQYKPEESK